MGSPLYTTRFAFDAGDPRSGEADLSAFRVRGIFSPEGHALHHIDIATRRDQQSDAARVTLSKGVLADVDDAATLLVIGEDLPLMWTTLTVEAPRDDALELFLIYEHRG